MTAAILRRAGHAVGVQALVSAIGFASAIAVARSSTVQEFGAFSAALAIYWASLGIARALGSETFSVAYSARSHEVQQAAWKSASSTVTLCGVATSILLVAAGLASDGAMRTAAFATAAIAPVLLLQDFARGSAFVFGRAGVAILSEAIVATSVVGGLAAIWVLGLATFPWIFATWALGAVAGLSTNLAVLRLRLAVPRALPWLVRHRRLALRYAAEAGLVAGATHVATLVVAASAGLAATAAIRGGQLLLGPITVLYLAVALWAVPEASRLMSRSEEAFFNLVKWLSLALPLLALIWGLAAALSPEALRAGVFGDSALPVWSVIVPLTIAVAASGAGTGAFVALRVFRASERSLRVRAIGAVLLLTFAFCGAQIYAAIGAAWGIAAGTIVMTALWWLEFVRHVSSSSRVEASQAVLET